MKTRKRHLEPGWCWNTGAEDPQIWGIVGHLDDAEVRKAVEAYECGDPGPLRIERDLRRNVPCRGGDFCDGDCGTHLVQAKAPGPGVVAYSWAHEVAS